jgi:hypothetical protein
MLEGWKQLAAVLDVGETAAFRYARRTADPLPIEYNHKGRVSMRKSVLLEWMARQRRRFHRDP